ncbi:MAG: type II toxin-antitoxin system Phd/YefM family antitoxin [Beijerinckiaceae bacterium]|jgi:antitoxin Phd|nr:type II toxin-antitoxin system Phd/YefM family antitoxin [Beijerinckiaceae bacterium]
MPMGDIRRKHAAKWSVVEAKAKFSEVVDRARAGEPQTITKNGKQAVVVVAADEWQRAKSQAASQDGTLYDFLRNSPLVGVDLDLERDRSPPRDIDL